MAVPMGPITETVPAELEMKRLATDYSVTIFLDWLTTSLDFHAQQTEAQSLSNAVLLEWQSIQLVTCMSGSDLCGLCYMVLTAHIPLPDPVWAHNMACQECLSPTVMSPWCMDTNSQSSIVE